MKPFKADPIDWEVIESESEHITEAAIIRELRDRIAALEQVQQQDEAAPLPHTPTLTALLHPAYEPGGGRGDGAQLVDGEWWHPIMGCDSLQIVVNNARAEQQASAQPAPPAPAGGLVEGIMEAACLTKRDAKWVLDTVAAWLDRRGQHACSLLLRLEADR